MLAWAALLAIFILGEPPNGPEAVVSPKTEAAKPATSEKPDVPAEVAEEADEQDQAKKKTEEANRIAAAKMLMPELILLSVLTILILFLGGIMFIRKFGMRVARTRPRKPVKYFDLSIPIEPPPPHEPSAEERLKDDR